MADTFTAEVTSAVPVPEDADLQTFDVTITHGPAKKPIGLYPRQFTSEGGDDLEEQIRLEIDVIRENLKAEQHADVGRQVKVTL